MNIVLSSYVVLFSDNSIDHEATLEKFASDLLRFEELKDKENAVIAGAIHSLFDQFQGARLNMPYVTGEVLRKLNAQPDNYKVLSDKVQAYIRENSQGDKAVFTINRGKGGGIARNSDMK